MCGIAGLWRMDTPNDADALSIQRMADALVHRGPDDSGYLCANARRRTASVQDAPQAGSGADLFLASRRLAILDLSEAGRQPLANEAGDIFVVFNGAIHNHLALRRELEALGHVFRSHTDTEVIVHAYEAWGEACANRFNGMWAYAIWDARASRLVLSRDRFGIKPLYISRQNGVFAFASEVKALVAGFAPCPTPDAEMLARYVAHGTAPTHRRTMFESVEALPAAHNLVITSAGAVESRYWDYAPHGQGGDTRQPDATFRELLDDATALRLTADVPVGILLSGGLDSSAITMLASRHLDGAPMHLFTSVFPGFWGDEGRYARVVADRTGLPLQFVEYDPTSFVEDLGRVVWHMDGLPLSAQVLPRWTLLGTAAQSVKVVLEGQGADELLAGYPWSHARPYIRDELTHLRPSNAASSLRRVWDAADVASRGRPVRFLARSASTALHREPPVDAFEHLLSRDTAALLGSAHIPRQHRSPFSGHLNAALWADHRRAILPHLLHFGDAISMAHSVESRLPFLDHRLVEFVFDLPFTEKSRGSQSKYLLRRALADDLPPAILNRRTKVGFETPLRRWLKRSFANVRTVVESPEARGRGLLDAAAVSLLMAGFERGHDARRDRAIFRLLATELWFRAFVDGHQPEARPPRTQPFRPMHG